MMMSIDDDEKHFVYCFIFIKANKLFTVPLQAHPSKQMFAFITKACSSDQSCPYEKALNYCTYADWNPPHQTQIQYTIECLQGKHTDVIRVQKAFLIFKTKFQKHQDKNNSAFRLKNLLLLDRCTEEKLILDLIANYEYNRLFYDRNKLDSSPQNKFIQQFICSYYLYIKKKADLYQRFPDELLNYKSRKTYLNNANNLPRIFQFIDFALQIQKTLNQTNQTLKKINKSPLLIQEILTFMLKTYIFLYTIVAISLQTLLGKYLVMQGRLKSLKLSELNNLERLLKYFSRDFTNTFLNFLQANKTIPAFKSFQYNEIIKIDPTYMSIFEKYYKLKMGEQSSEGRGEKRLAGTPTTMKSSIVDSQQFQQQVLQLPQQVYQKLTQQLKFKHQPRHIIQQVPSSDDHIFEVMFIDYKNYYSEDFIRDYNLSSVKEISEVGGSKSPELLKKSTKIQKKKSIMAELINSKDLKRMEMKEKLPSKNFKQAKWITWQNLYSET